MKTKLNCMETRLNGLKSSATFSMRRIVTIDLVGKNNFLILVLNVAIYTKSKCESTTIENVFFNVISSFSP